MSSELAKEAVRGWLREEQEGKVKGIATKRHKKARKAGDGCWCVAGRGLPWRSYGGGGSGGWWSWAG